MSVEKRIDPSLAAGKFDVWYERFWRFKTSAEAEAFAADLDRRKTAECAAYGFSPPIVFLYFPKEAED